MEPRKLTDSELTTYAALLASGEGFKEIIRELKADVIRQWANEESSAKRDYLFHDIQAIGRFVAKVQSLAEAKTIADRKGALLDIMNTRATRNAF